jgi:hypothetical protein
MTLKNFFIICSNVLFSKNIILINSPFQFLSFIELENLEKKKQVKFKYIFLGYTSNKRINIIKYINEKIYFSNYYIIPFKDNINVHLLHYLIKFRKYFLKKFRNIIFGDFSYYLFKEFYKISNNKLMLDDGSKTLIFNERFDLDKKNLTIFTIFKEEFSGIRTIVHNFSFLKNFFNKSKSINEKINYYIGSPFVESGILTKNQYLYLINKIKSYYKNVKFTYVPHQFEKKHNYSGYKFKKILIPRCGLELYLANANFYPNLIVGSHSTLFISLKKIFNNNIKLNPFYFEVNRHVKAQGYNQDEIAVMANYFKKNILKKIKKISINIS